MAEAPDRSRLRTDNPLFDGLLALAVEDSIGDRVEQIVDAQFNDGHAIPCRCLETKAQWHSVWTRDVPHAADLGLAYLDPTAR